MIKSLMLAVAATTALAFGALGAPSNAKADICYGRGYGGGYGGGYGVAYRGGYGAYGPSYVAPRRSFYRSGGYGPYGGYGYYGRSAYYGPRRGVSFAIGF